MSGLANYWKSTTTSVGAEEKFSELKYQQYLSDKYLVKTCFSRRDESYSNKQKLKDLLSEIEFSCNE